MEGPGRRVGVLHRCGAGARRGAGEGGLHQRRELAWVLRGHPWVLRGHPSLLPADPMLGAVLCPGPEGVG